MAKPVKKHEPAQRMFVSVESAREASKIVGLRIFWRPTSLVDPESAKGRDLAEILDH